MAYNNTCACPITYSRIIEASRSYFSTTLSVFAIASNLLTILVLRRVRMKSSTEKLLLAITTADLVLPVVHLSRYVYVSYIDRTADEIFFFRTLLFYLWHVFYIISIQLTLVLAFSRCIAIEYAHLYQKLCRRQHTNRVIFAVCVFSAGLLIPILFHRPDFKDPVRNAKRHCKPDLSREVIYTSITLATVHLRQNGALKLSYWLYIFVFQLGSPIILAILSTKFRRSLSKKITTKGDTGAYSKLAQAKAKTKLILIVSLMVMVRDLPLGLLSTFFIFSSPHPGCLTTIRLLTKEMTIVLSAMNFVMLYCTNVKFKKAVPRLGLCSTSREVQQEMDVYVYNKAINISSDTDV